LGFDVGESQFDLLAQPSYRHPNRGLQHDCGPGAFFRSRRANDWVGRVLGVITLTPYDHWRASHAVHHATSGNLEHRGIGDIDTLTVREYLEMSWWHRFRYRLYRNPFVMFGIGPAYLFLLKNRFPIGGREVRWRAWLSTGATNAAVALVFASAIWLVGVGAFLLIHVPIMLIAASIGVWLFTFSTSLKKRFGPRMTLGPYTRLFMAARTMICLRSYAG
jgi:acyl-lipid omega-6 desaturase (Delta-12 desaturase)